MQRTSFVLGIALFVVASTLAVTITLRNPSPAGDESAERASRQGPPSSGDSRPGLGGGVRSPAPKARRDPRANENRFFVDAPSDHPQRAELSQKAAAVESEARTELVRLTDRLELTSEQQRRLFPILARTAAEYDEELIISYLTPGAPPLAGSAGRDELNRVLEPGQQDQLLEDTLTDLALWEGIIEKLQRRLEVETPQVAPTNPGIAPHSDRAPRRRGNLYEDLPAPQ